MVFRAELTMIKIIAFSLIMFGCGYYDPDYIGIKSPHDKEKLDDKITPTTKPTITPSPTPTPTPPPTDTSPIAPSPPPCLQDTQENLLLIVEEAYDELEERIKIADHKLDKCAMSWVDYVYETAEQYKLDESLKTLSLGNCDLQRAIERAYDNAKDYANKCQEGKVISRIKALNRLAKRYEDKVNIFNKSALEYLQRHQHTECPDRYSDNLGKKSSCD